MSFNKTYGGDYLNVETLKSDGLVNKPITIKGVETREFTNPADNRKWNSFVLSFNETAKTFTLDKKNGKVLASAYGDDEQLWAGKKIMPVVVSDSKKGEVIQLVIPA